MTRTRAVPVLLLALVGAVLVAPAAASAAEVSSCAGSTRVATQDIRSSGGTTVGRITVYQDAARTRWCVKGERLGSVGVGVGTVGVYYQSTTRATTSPSPYAPTSNQVTDGTSAHYYAVAAKRSASTGRTYQCLYVGLNVSRGEPGANPSYGGVATACFT